MKQLSIEEILMLILLYKNKHPEKKFIDFEKLHTMGLVTEKHLTDKAENFIVYIQELSKTL